MRRSIFTALMLALVGAFWLASASAGEERKGTAEAVRLYSLKKDAALREEVSPSESGWEKLLTAELYHVQREQGSRTCPSR